MTKAERPRKFISYLRVSTDRQGLSGLGLEAQRDTVKRYVEGRAGALVAEYVEVESGRNPERPRLAAARVHAKRAGAVLVFAKLDRLARDVDVVREVVRSGVRVVFCDLPDLPMDSSGELMVNIMASFAEFEARRISERTKAALTAAKARGVVLGNPKGAAALRLYHAARKRQGIPHRTGASAAREAVQSNAVARAEGLAETIRELRSHGIDSHRGLAEVLNAKGLRSPRGGRWHPTTVARLLRRLTAVPV
jgi:DNA invertase Pin-like site-specific DNA recombinase